LVGKNAGTEITMYGYDPNLMAGISLKVQIVWYSATFAVKDFAF